MENIPFYFHDKKSLSYLQWNYSHVFWHILFRFVKQTMILLSTASNTDLYTSLLKWTQCHSCSIIGQSSTHGSHEYSWTSSFICFCRHSNKKENGRIIISAQFSSVPVERWLVPGWQFWPQWSVAEGITKGLSCYSFLFHITERN